MDKIVEYYLKLFDLQFVIDNDNYDKSYNINSNGDISFSYFDKLTKEKIGGIIYNDEVLINHIIKDIDNYSEEFGYNMQRVNENRNVFNIFKLDDRVMISKYKHNKIYELLHSDYILLENDNNVDSFYLPIDINIDFRNGIINSDKIITSKNNDIRLDHTLTSTDLTNEYNEMLEKLNNNDNNDILDIMNLYIKLLGFKNKGDNKCYIDDNGDYNLIIKPYCGASISLLKVSSDYILYKQLIPIFGKNHKIIVLEQTNYKIYVNENGIVKEEGSLIEKEVGNDYYRFKNIKNNNVSFKNNIDFRTFLEKDEKNVKKLHF